LNDRLHTLKQTVDDTAPALEDVRTIVSALQDDLTEVRGLLDQGVTDYPKWKKALEGLRNNCNDLADDLNIMEGAINDLEWTTDSFGSALKGVAEGGASTQLGMAAGQLQAAGLSAVDPAGLTTVSALAQLVATLEKISGSGASLSSSVADLSVDLEGVFHTSDDLVTSLGKVIDLTTDALTQIDARQDTWYDLIDQAYDAGGILTQLTTMLDALDEQTDAALDEIDQTHANSLTAVADTQALIDTSTTAVTALHTFLKTAESTLQKTGNELDAGTQQTLNALIDVLGKTVNGLAQTGTIQNAKDTIKDLIDDKWDEYSGEDNNILLMDTEAAPVSLTSTENAAPDSVQIILRTAEITTEDEDEDNDVDEDFHSSGTVFSRIASIFRQLIEAIRQVFAKN
jgi:putative membrane protein